MSTEEYYMVICSFPHDVGIHVIPKSKITPDILKRMEKEIGKYPHWCDEDYDEELYEEDDPLRPVCDINEIGICLSSEGKNDMPYTITRVFFYEFA